MGMTKIQAYHNTCFNSKFKANRGWRLTWRGCRFVRLSAFGSANKRLILKLSPNSYFQHTEGEE
jgi:hypothetical protein